MDEPKPVSNGVKEFFDLPKDAEYFWESNPLPEPEPFGEIKIIVRSGGDGYFYIFCKLPVKKLVQLDRSTNFQMAIGIANRIRNEIADQGPITEAS